MPLKSRTRRRARSSGTPAGPTADAAPSGSGSSTEAESPSPWLTSEPEAAEVSNALPDTKVGRQLAQLRPGLASPALVSEILAQEAARDAHTLLTHRMAALDARLGVLLNADPPDLDAIENVAGKLLSWQHILDHRAAHVREVSPAVVEASRATASTIMSQVGRRATFPIPSVLLEREEHRSYNQGPDDELVTTPTCVKACQVYKDMVEECLRWWQGVETWEHDARVVVYPLTALASATGIIQRGEELAELAGEVTDAIEEANAYRRESGYSYQAAHRPPVPGRTVNLFLDVRDTA